MDRAMNARFYIKHVEKTLRGDDAYHLYEWRPSRSWFGYPRWVLVGTFQARAEAEAKMKQMSDASVITTFYDTHGKEIIDGW